eukprot:1140937-Pelagomonas_calceolata.AAC.3
MVTEVTVLLLEGFELILGLVVFTVFDLLKMDMPLFWKEQDRMTDLGSKWSGRGWRRVLPVPPHAPLYFSTDSRNWSLALFLIKKLVLHQGD